MTRETYTTILKEQCCDAPPVEIKVNIFFEGGQIVREDESTDKEMKPRSLGGTLFKVEE